MLWGVSGVALYVPWAGGVGPWISISLWLWLGVLDAVQGVGLGMILLQTLSRLHVCATLAFSQMLGSIVVIVARATVPTKQVFPDFGLWNVGDGIKHSPFSSVVFWVALVCQIVVVVGYFWYYRKEQLGTWLHRLLRLFLSDLLCLFHSTTVNTVHLQGLFIQSLSFSLQRVSSMSYILSHGPYSPSLCFLSVVDFPPRTQFVFHDLMISTFQSHVCCSHCHPVIISVFSLLSFCL